MQGISTCKRSRRWRSKINFHACFDIKVSLYELRGESKIEHKQTDNQNATLALLAPGRALLSLTMKRLGRSSLALKSGSLALLAPRLAILTLLQAPRRATLPPAMVRARVLGMMREGMMLPHREHSGVSVHFPTTKFCSSQFQKLTTHPHTNTPTHNTIH